MNIKIDAKTEKLVTVLEGTRIEGEEEVGKGKNAHTYRWMRYISFSDKQKEVNDQNA